MVWPSWTDGESLTDFGRMALNLFDFVSNFDDYSSEFILAFHDCRNGAAVGLGDLQFGGALLFVVGVLGHFVVGVSCRCCRRGQLCCVITMQNIGI